MNNKDKFLMFLSLICLPFGELAAEQIGNMEVFPINQEIQQNVKITGRVIDAGGEAIIGASIVEKGTTNGTITDFDGNFTLNVRTNAKLVVSYVGYVTQEVMVTPNKELNIVLKEDAETLDEVVVVGYGSVKKSDLTGAVASVSTKDLIRSGNTDAVGALQGAMSGVQISRSSSKPGSEYNI